MSTSVSWPPIGGTTYSIPASGELNWQALSTFLIAIGNAAQGTVNMKLGMRIALTTPVTVVSATDLVVLIDLTSPGATTVNLPAGVTGQAFFIVDSKGDAATNNITIDPNASEQINGASTYVINKNRAGVLIGFNGTSWNILAEYLSIASGTIPRSAIAAGTPNHVIINDGSGNLSSEAALAKSRGGSGIDNTSVTFPSTGVLVTEAASETLTNKTISGASNTLTVRAASDITGQLPIANGGTAAATANAGFNALSPSTTKGDLIGFSTVNARLGVGANDTVLIADSAQTLGIRWGTPNGQLTGPMDIKNLTVAASVGSSALTLALKNLAGNDPSSGDPVVVSFRNATAATGNYTSVSAVAATSVVVSSGSTLGQVSGIATTFYLYAINNAGTLELAVSTRLFDEGSIVTTTAEGGAGAADSATTIYSTTARSNVPLRLIARMVSNQVTAGTWALVPTEIALGDNYMTNRLITPWVAYTPTGTWSANTTYTAFWRRIGDSIDLDITLAITGTPTSATLTVNIPTGMTIDTAKLTSAINGGGPITGNVYLLDSGTADYVGMLTYSSTTAIRPMWLDDSSSPGVAPASITQAAPYTFANGDKIVIRAMGLPIAEFAF